MKVLPNPELTPEELETLKSIRDTDPRKSVRKRAQVILLAHKRYQGIHIAGILDLTPKSVTVILQKWAQSRLESVIRKRNRGRDPILKDLHVEAIKEWISQDPSVYGYKQTTWTCKLLVDCLKKKYSLKLSHERIRQRLHAQGLSYKKPTLQPPTASPDQKKSARRFTDAVRSGV